MDVQIKQEVDDFESVVVKEEFCVDEVNIPDFPNENGISVKSENADELVKPEYPEEFVQFEITEIQEPDPCQKVAETIRCSICKQAFRSKHKRGEHMITHHSRESYYCAHCPTKFVFKWSLRVHLLHHMKRAKMQCFVCKKKVTSLSCLYRHVKKHYDGKCYKCKICKKRYYDSTYLMNHIQTVHTMRNEKLSDVLYECDICQKQIRSLKLLQKHKSVEHGEKASFKCPYCEKNFARQTTIETHISVDHRGLPVDPSLDPPACTVCEKVFTDFATLRKHVMVHSIETSYKCRFCQKKYHTAGAIHQHVMLDHKKTIIPDDFPNGWKEYKCSRTGKTFPAVLQKKGRPSDSSRPGSNMCPYCRRTFWYKGRLDQHIRAHERHLELYLCRICGKAYPGRNNRNIHEKNAHSTGELQIQMQPDSPGTMVIVRMDKVPEGEDANGQVVIKSEEMENSDEISKSEEEDEDFVYYDVTDDPDPLLQCSLCDQSFDTVERTKAHEADHKFAPFTCAHCPTMFQFKWSLQLHLLNHLEHPVLECFVCGLTFVLFSNLKSHVKEHFQCSKCREPFSEIDHLQKHTEDCYSRDPRNPINRFKCEICDAIFLKSGYLKRHKMLSHNKCPYCDKLFVKKSNIEIHIERYHIGLPLDSSRQPPTCTVCNEAYGSIEALKKHVKTHSIEKGFECGFCKDSFETSGQIRDHVTELHNGQKLPDDFPNSWGYYTCQNTGRKFSSIHNNKPLYKCSICHQGFHFKYELNNHIQWHKKQDSNRTRFPCRFCAMSFPSQEDVRNHEKDHSQDDKVNSLFLLLKKAKDAATTSKSGGPSRTTSNL